MAWGTQCRATLTNKIPEQWPRRGWYKTDSTCSWCHSLWCNRPHNLLPWHDVLVLAVRRYPEQFKDTTFVIAAERKSRTIQLGDMDEALGPQENTTRPACHNWQWQHWQFLQEKASMLSEWHFKIPLRGIITALINLGTMSSRMTQLLPLSNSSAQHTSHKQRLSQWRSCDSGYLRRDIQNQRGCL